eukprot:CAMPEP_0175494880 /NCGR_PEP_ID=MMETSP0096-20121207/3508_1 /TAXON_ID=311494 /ORGANISM="Alexandrium monilatum, Strain CCMP3105" /LENGTH=301 /DNA_ID=CAMNT_0016796853 /DNA_START=51 /DNA_END=957 /DNA_ORIENTATION=+
MVRRNVRHHAHRAKQQAWGSSAKQANANHNIKQEFRCSHSQLQAGQQRIGKVKIAMPAWLPGHVNLTAALAVSAAGARNGSEYERLGLAQEVVQVLGRPAGDLGLVVPQPELNCALRVRLPDPLRGLRRREWATLQLQRALAVLREPVPVARTARAQVALGRDVEPDGLDHLRGEAPLKPIRADGLMAVVRLEEVRLVRMLIDEQVPDVMEQRTHDRRVAGALLLRQRRALQRVLELRHVLVVERRAALRVEVRHIRHEPVLGAHAALEMLDQRQIAGLHRSALVPVVLLVQETFLLRVVG